MARLGRRGLFGGVAAISATLWLPRPAQAASAMGFDDARHLLSRTSFGQTPAEIHDLEPFGFSDAVERLHGDDQAGVRRRGKYQCAQRQRGKS